MSARSCGWSWLCVALSCACHPVERSRPPNAAQPPTRCARPIPTCATTPHVLTPSEVGPGPRSVLPRGGYATIRGRLVRTQHAECGADKDGFECLALADPGRTGEVLAPGEPHVCMYGPALGIGRECAHLDFTPDFDQRECLKQWATWDPLVDRPPYIAGCSGKGTEPCMCLHARGQEVYASALLFETGLAEFDRAICEVPRSRP
jgi:hypothetical protein